MVSIKEQNLFTIMEVEHEISDTLLCYLTLVAARKISGLAKIAEADTHYREVVCCKNCPYVENCLVTRYEEAMREATPERGQ